MKDEVDSLLQKPMNRLDFLKHVGVGIAAITGAAMVIKTMNNLGGTSAKQRNVGYGSASYGGNKVQPPKVG